MGEPGASKTAALTEVNRQILGAAREAPSREEVWEFFCECGGPDCHEHVRLTLDEYVALHDGGDAVLAHGHRLSQVERALRLSIESVALRRQADLQVTRAKKNVRNNG